MLWPHVMRVAAAGADIIWVLFVTVQALDGALTWVGIGAFGLSAERNPLIAWYAHAIGSTAAVIGAKLFAVSCGGVLYLTRQFPALAGLALLYVVFAIGPWIEVLATSL